jgi:acyl carrier protein
VSVAEEVERFMVVELSPGMDAIPHDLDLLAGEVIDSLGIVQLISFLEEKYGVNVGDDDLDPENFRSVDTIASFVEERRA